MGMRAHQLSTKSTLLRALKMASGGNCYEWTPISSSLTSLQVLIRHVILTFHVSHYDSSLTFSHESL